MKSNTASASQNLSYVDAARGIAILLVVLVHVFPTVPGLSPQIIALCRYGQLGVLLFFVASAFTLCRAFEVRRNEPNNIKAFFIRRFWRIAPLYYVGITLYFGISGLVPETDPNMNPHPYTTLNIIANILFIHGFVPSANNSIVPGGWSIGTEMAFYACFPLLFKYFELLNTKRGIRALIAITTATILINFSLQLAFGLHFGRGMNNSFRYYNLVNQLPVFMMGMLAYFIIRNGHEHRLLNSKPAMVISVLATTAASLSVWEYQPNFMFALITPIAGFSFFCLLFLLRQWRSPTALLCHIGQASFSIYIFHFVFVKAVLKPFLAVHEFSAPPVLLLLAGFLFVSSAAFCVAFITKPYIEDRGTRFGSEIIKRSIARQNVTE